MPSRDTSESARRRPGSVDLGIVDALVQGSFLIQEMLGEIAAEHDLSITQIRLLGVLRDREPRMLHLAQFLGLSKQSATGLVDRAQRHGLVRRTAIPVGDERAVHVALTDTGRELATEIAAQVARRVSAVAADLSETNRGRLSKLLSQIVLRDAELHGTDLSTSTSRVTT
jgi:DNA-binding MarR family transcriptional regulator